MKGGGGMRYPFCTNEDTQVKDSLPTEDNFASPFGPCIRPEAFGNPAMRVRGARPAAGGGGDPCIAKRFRFDCFVASPNTAAPPELGAKADGQNRGRVGRNNATTRCSPAPAIDLDKWLTTDFGLCEYFVAGSRTWNPSGD